MKLIKNIFVIIVVVLAFGIAIAACSGESEAATEEDNGETFISAARNADAKSEKPETAGKSETIGQKNARRSAESYIKLSAFSYDGLINQLKFEGYSDEDAKYGADNCNANWLDEAAQSAQQYLNIMPMSRDELKNQLEFEGFTADQIEHALSEVGY